MKILIPDEILDVAKSFLDDCKIKGQNTLDAILATSTVEIFDALRETVKNIAGDVEGYIKAMNESVNNCGGIEKFLQCAYNCEEKECDVITFAECLAWSKAHLDVQKHSGVAIGKIEQKNGFFKPNTIVLKLCFLNKAGEMLADSESAYLIVRCTAMDAELQNAFGDKNTVVLK